MSEIGSEAQVNSTPVFRGHHLVCLHFYDGTGYNSQFIKYLADILNKAEKNAVKICSGADCICIECPHLRDGICACYENAEADIRFMDSKALELLGLFSDEKISWKDVRTRVEKIFCEWNRLYCMGCDWRSACENNPGFRKLISYP
jgi:uncharacterized protein